MAKIISNTIQEAKWQGDERVKTLKFLAIDTAGSICSIAILKQGQIHTLDETLPAQQTKHLLPMLQNLLAALSLSLTELDGICFSAGPGSFTGIRVATCTAQALGFALHKPLIPISSLAALAQTLYLKRFCTEVWVAVDAHRDQIYWAVYQAQADHGLVVAQKEILTLPEKIPLPTGIRACGIGNGWEKYAHILKSTLGEAQPTEVHSANVATAEAMLYLAIPLFLQGKWISASEASPVYLR